MQRVADQSLKLVEHADGTLIGMRDGAGMVLFVCGAGVHRDLVGMTVPVDQSLSGRTLETCEVQVSSDSAHDPRVNLEAAFRSRALSIVSIPIRRDGEPVGVMNVSSSRADAFDADDIRTLSAMAEFVSAVVVAAAELTVSADRLLERVAHDELGVRFVEKVEGFVSNILSPAAAQMRRDRRLIEEILDNRRISMYFQPVVDLRDGSIVAVEALARFFEDPYRPPDQWFAMAETVGLGLELEFLAVESALAHLDHLAPGVRMAVNASPVAIMSSRLLSILAASASDRLILEVTEHADVDDYDVLIAAQDLLRRTGVMLAVDDTGAGISSLAHILKLHPDFIKLDRELTTGIDNDPGRRSIASSLAKFASETGARIIAEGVENNSEFDVLCALGIEFGQGFYLHMPQPFSGLPPEIVVGSNGAASGNRGEPIMGAGEVSGVGSLRQL
jgi:EAL domain-containing protein (putative c-di-GMP-specific phosphodiesterase class I)